MGEGPGWAGVGELWGLAPGGIPPLPAPPPPPRGLRAEPPHPPGAIVPEPSGPKTGVLGGIGTAGGAPTGVGRVKIASNRHLAGAEIAPN